MIYVMNNSTGPIYGALSLIANGTVVVQTPGEVFNTGLSATSLSWEVPMSYKNATYILSARGDFYGTAVETPNATVAAIPPFRFTTLSGLSPLAPVRDSLGEITGEPVGVYSSFENQDGYSYKVVSPDGTCVLGREDTCLVTSIAGVNRSTVTIGNQIYTVEYGETGMTQRFSITSQEPIIGAWKVEIERDGLVQEDMMSKVMAKIEYEVNIQPPQ